MKDSEGELLATVNRELRLRDVALNNNDGKDCKKPVQTQFSERETLLASSSQTPPDLLLGHQQTAEGTLYRTARGEEFFLD